MGENAKVAWTDHTFQAWWGCTKVSPGCTNCYADSLDRRIHGGEHWGPKASRKIFGDKYWNNPRRWNKKAAKEGKRFRVFCSSMADVFEIHMLADMNAKMDECRARLWELIRETPNLDWLILTKRPENFNLLPEVFENVWLGVTTENQEEANRRLPLLLQQPAVVRFASYEPALDLVDFTSLPDGSWWDAEGAGYYNALRGFSWQSNGDLGLSGGPHLDWVIVGAESGTGRRPMDEDWVRNTRDACTLADVAFFYKQKIEGNKTVELPELDGQTWAQFPFDR